MTDQPLHAAEPLADALERMAADLGPREPPPGVQRAVLSRWQPAAQLALTHGGPLRPSGWAPWTTAALVGALLVISTALLLGAPTDIRPPTADLDARFVPVASAERWPSASGGGAPAWLVHAELPRERLAEFGLPFDPTRAGDTVRTELLMRASGEVLAVRVLADTHPR